MKTHIVKLIILFTILSPSLIAQEEYPLLKELEESEESIGRDEIPKSYRIRKNQRVKKDNSIFNDCSCVTKADYHLPNGYTSNFVKMPNGQTYTGSKKGILMWDKYAKIQISTENSKIPENNITALALDDDQLWIGTKNSGIVIGIHDDVKPFRVIYVQTREQNIVSISNGYNYMWVVYASGGIECFLNGISCAYFPME